MLPPVEHVGHADPTNEPWIRQTFGGTTLDDVGGKRCR
jgi:hypothetical protein